MMKLVLHQQNAHYVSLVEEKLRLGHEIGQVIMLLKMHKES